MYRKIKVTTWTNNLKKKEKKRETSPSISAMHFQLTRNLNSFSRAKQKQNRADCE